MAKTPTPKPAVKRPAAKLATAKAATAKLATAKLATAKPAASRKIAAKPAATQRAKPSTTAPAKPSTKSRAKPVSASKPATTQSSTTKRGIAGNTAWSIGAVLVAAGAGFAAFLGRGRIAAALAPSEGHVPTDLLGSKRNADDRAIADFRPDMDAIMTASEREALRPPVGKPSMTASNGSMNAIDAPLN